MRVRISYSVDLQDVPNECARMLQESLEKFSEIQRELEDLIDQLDNDQGIGWQVKSKIENCRKKMSKLDHILADNDMILEGYYKATEVNEEPSDVE